MCFMNLSDCSKYIHHSIEVLKEGVKKLQKQDEKDWIFGLFGNWGLTRVSGFAGQERFINCCNHCCSINIVSMFDRMYV